MPTEDSHEIRMKVTQQTWDDGFEIQYVAKETFKKSSKMHTGPKVSPKNQTHHNNSKTHSQKEHFGENQKR